MDNSKITSLIDNLGAAPALVYILKENKIAQWTSCFPGKTPLGYEISRPAVVTIQFVDEGKKDIFLSLISRFESQVDWLLQPLKFNEKWRLIPSKVQEVIDTHDKMTALEAAGIVQNDDEKYGKLTNFEIERLVYELASYYQQENSSN